MAFPEYVNINGTSYSTSKFSEAACTQVVNLQIADTEINHLQQQLGLAQTARNVFVNELLKAIKEDKPAAKAKVAEAAPAEAPAPAKKPRAKKAV